VRLQHGGAEALYRASLQAATVRRLLSGFRKIGGASVLLSDLLCKTKRAPVLGLTDGVAAAIGVCSPAAIRPDCGGNHQAVKEQYGNSEDE